MVANNTRTRGGHHLLHLALVLGVLAIAHLQMRTLTNWHILQLALCGGGGGICNTETRAYIQVPLTRVAGPVYE